MTTFKTSVFIARQQHHFISLLNSCPGLKQLKQIHTQLLITAHLSHPQLLDQIISSIPLKNTNILRYFTQLVDQCETPTLCALNSMIRAHSKGSTPQKSFHFYNKIVQSSNDIRPDHYTFNFLVRTCSQLLAHGTGMGVHGGVIKRGLEFDSHIHSGLIFMYAELGCLDSCHKVFEIIPHPDLVCQTAMVSACTKCGDVSFARKVFDLMPQRDGVAWSAMIAGHAQCGQPRKALHLFYFMQLKGVKVNEVALVSVLSACGQLGGLDHGRWVHAYIKRNMILVTVTLGTALIDMYSKCGEMNEAMEVFWGMKEKNVYTWSCTMNGLAMNGASDKCLELFSLMKGDGVLPNEVTFVSILKACSVVGLVEEGREHFESMRRDYGIEPRYDHYGCLVDLYGRTGRLYEALDIIKTMPMKPHVGAWGALLNSCTLYKNMELGELASRKIIELEGKHHGAYVLLSNIFAGSKNWERAGNVRQTMTAKGLRKQPGCSAIEVDGEVHEFFLGDKSHPRYAEIDVMLGEISRRQQVSGNVISTNPMLIDN